VKVHDADTSLEVAGSAVAIGGGLVGVIMALIPDSANLNVVPLPGQGKLRILPGLGPRYEHGLAKASAPDVPGLSLRYEF